MGRRISQNEWINLAINKHGDTYDYSQVQYIHSESNVTIICKIHGPFQQKAYRHLQGHGCKECAKQQATSKKIKSQDNVIKDFIKVHGDNYDYSQVKYVDNLTPVIIGCKKCGNYFSKIPSTILQYGCECPFCKNIGVSIQEKEIYDFLKTIYSGTIEVSNRNILSNGLELDIYLPEKKIAIEFNGLYWHSENKKPNNYHLLKTEECDNKGIQLIQIFEDEWLHKRKIVESRLQQIIGCNRNKNFIGRASQFNIFVLSNDKEKTFFENNHLQGYINSSICYGLGFVDSKNIKRIFAVMSFGSLRNNMNTKSETGVFEMYRYAVAKKFTIHGAASKLFKYFLKNYKPKKVISFANRRWSKGNLYEKLGFEFVGYTKPSFSIVIGNKRFNRYALRKDILVSKYGCPKEMTADEFYNHQKWNKIYDCGNLKYEYKL